MIMIRMLYLYLTLFFQEVILKMESIVLYQHRYKKKLIKKEFIIHAYFMYQYESCITYISVTVQ